MKAALVTGAAGFIGRHLARRLASEGYRVVGIGHGSWEGGDPGEWGIHVWLHGDISSENLEAVGGSCGAPEVIFHLAGGSSVTASLDAPARDFRRSVDSTATVLEWVRKCVPHAAVVLASSAAVYGSGHAAPIAETAAMTPYSPYGFHKRMAELLMESYGRSFGLRTAVVRLFSVYGAGLRKQLLWDLCSRLHRGEERIALFGDGTEMRDWLHVDDAVEFLCRVAAHASAEPFIVNGATGSGAAVREIAQEVCAAWGKGQISFLGNARAGDPRFLVADAARGRAMGLVPQVDVASGVRSYVEWFKTDAGATR